MKIAYFAPIAFNDLKQRPQHIAETLSKDYEIYYIEPTISYMKYVLKGGEIFKKNFYDINQNLHVIRANGLLTAHRSLEAIDLFCLNTVSEQIQLRSIIQSCDVIWVGYPGWYNLIRTIKNKIIVYDKMDDDVEIANSTMLKSLIRRVEPKLIEKANIIFVTCQEFYNRIKPHKSETYLIRNAVPIEFTNQNNLEYTRSSSSGGRHFGYIGTVSNWFDYKAIEIILEEHEENKITILGNNYVKQWNSNRIVYQPAVSKEQLPYYIRQFEICLYPFIKSDWLNTINPVKIYEYLAFNKPILAIASAETNVLREYCCLYEDHDELRKKCNQPIKVPFADKALLNHFLENNTWESRVAIIKSILISHL